MNRESALLGTPTYTVFAGRIAAADQELIRTGRMRDLRPSGTVPAFVKKRPQHEDTSNLRRDQIAKTVKRALAEAMG